MKKGLRMVALMTALMMLLCGSALAEMVVLTAEPPAWMEASEEKTAETEAPAEATKEPAATEAPEEQTAEAAGQTEISVQTTMEKAESIVIGGLFSRAVTGETISESGFTVPVLTGPGEGGGYFWGATGAGRTSFSSSALFRAGDNTDGEQTLTREDITGMIDFSVGRLSNPVDNLTATAFYDNAFPDPKDKEIKNFEKKDILINDRPARILRYDVPNNHYHDGMIVYARKSSVLIVEVKIFADEPNVAMSDLEALAKFISYDPEWNKE